MAERAYSELRMKNLGLIAAAERMCTILHIQELEYSRCDPDSCSSPGPACRTG